MPRNAAAPRVPAQPGVTQPMGDAARAIDDARDLAWVGEHERAGAGCTLALQAANLTPAERVALLDRRAQSLIALGRLTN